MYIKGLVNTNDQSNECMCEMMSKGLKEALTVLIVTYVTHVKRVKITFDPFNIHSIGWYGWKGLSSAFQKFFSDENRLNIRKVMSKNVFVPCFNIT